MTGAYLRVNRGGEWVNVEVEHLTRIEREAYLGGKSSEELFRWLTIVCEKLCEAETSLDDAININLEQGERDE